jgi:hypothetical protein
MQTWFTDISDATKKGSPFSIDPAKPLVGCCAMSLLRDSIYVVVIDHK